MLSRQLWVSFLEASSCLSKSDDAHPEDLSLMSRAHSAVMQCRPRMPNGMCIRRSADSAKRTFLTVCAGQNASQQ